MSGLGKQAKTVSTDQLRALLAWLAQRRNADRNRLIVLLSFKAGLRAKEIAALKWSMVVDAGGQIGTHLHLPNSASKGRSGRVIPLNTDLRKLLVAMNAQRRGQRPDSFVITTERSEHVSAQVIVNLFARLVQAVGLRRMLVPFRSKNFHHQRRTQGFDGRRVVARRSSACWSFVLADDCPIRRDRQRRAIQVGELGVIHREGSAS